MSLIRFRPSSFSIAAVRKDVGRCAACEKPVSGRDRSVRIYGDLFHSRCAFYEPRAREERLAVSRR